MKTPVSYLLPFCALFLFACGPTTASRNQADAIRFDTAKPLDDFVTLFDEIVYGETK